MTIVRANLIAGTAENVVEFVFDHVLISEELEEGIRANNDYDVLPVFNRFV